MAYTFDGVDDYFSQAFAGAPYPSTLLVRVNFDDIVGTEGMLVWKQDGNSSKVGLRKSNDIIQAHASISGGANSSGSGAAAISAATWYSIAGVQPNSSSRTAWINGVAGTTNGINRNVTSADTFLLGAYTDTAGTGNIQSFLDGQMCELAWYDVALTEAEIISHHRGFSARRIRPKSRVGIWRLVRGLQNMKGGVLTVNSAPAVSPHPRAFG